VWIADMALHAAHGDIGRNRSAASDFQRVASARDRGWFADDAVVDGLPVLLQPAEHLWRTVDCGAFFVAGDEQADRTFRRAVLKIARRCSSKRRDGGLHVHSAASIEH